MYPDPPGPRTPVAPIRPVQQRQQRIKPPKKFYTYSGADPRKGKGPPLKPNQILAFQPGRGYYAKVRPIGKGLGTPAPAGAGGAAPAVGPTPPPAPGAPAPPSPEWSQDPLYLRALGAYGSRVDAAKAAKLEEQKKLLLGFGSQELARGVLGNDDPFINTISADPSASFSTLANLQRQYGQDVSQFQGDVANQNLAFGSARGLGMERLGTGLLQQRRTAEDAVRAALLGAQGAYDTEAGAALADLLEAEGGAFGRALENPVSGVPAAGTEETAAQAAQSDARVRGPWLPKAGARGFTYQAAARKAMKPGQKIYYRSGRYYLGPK